MFERKVDSCMQSGTIAVGNGLKYKNVVVKAAGSRRVGDDLFFYVDICPAKEEIAKELLTILENNGFFTIDPFSKEITN